MPVSPLAPAVHHILLENLELKVDIGFHAFEIGHPQRLLVSVDVGIDLEHWPASDSGEASWNYDILYSRIRDLCTARRFNLQETVAREIWDMIVALPGVISLRIALRKPDVYPDAEFVGVVLASA